MNAAPNMAITLPAARKPGDELVLLFRDGQFLAGWYDHDGLGYVRLDNYLYEAESTFNVRWKQHKQLGAPGFPGAWVSTWRNYMMLTV